MGKLHTLRRAIEREPEKWFTKAWANDDLIMPYAAHRWRDKWEPYRGWYGSGSKAYRRFVAKVLKNLGYKVST